MSVAADMENVFMVPTIIDGKMMKRRGEENRKRRTGREEHGEEKTKKRTRFFYNRVKLGSLQLLATGPQFMSGQY